MIKKITIKNFRGLENLSVDTDSPMILTAPNGSGKSSFIDAFRYFVNGKISDDDIRHGTDTASVEVIFESGKTLIRSRNKGEGKCHIDGKDVDKKIFDDVLSKELNCSLETANAVCGTDFLDGLSTKDLSAFLLNILPITVKAESLDALIKETLGKDLMPDEKKFLETYLTHSVYTLDDFTEIYKSVYEARKIRKKDLAEVKAKATFDVATLPSESEDTLKKALEEIALKEASVKDYETRLKNYNNSVEAHTKAINRKATIEEQLKEYDGVEKPDQAVYEKAESDKKQFMDAITKHSNTLSFNQNRLNELIAAYKSIENPICPLTKANCTADLSQYKQKIADEGNKGAALIKEEQAFIKRCQDEVNDRDATIKAYNENNLKWTKKESLLNELNNLVIPPILEKPEEVKAEDISAEKMAINQKMAIYSQFKASQEYAKQAMELSREVEILEKSVKLFDVKGIKATLLKKALAPVEAIVNKSASTIRDKFKISLIGAEGLDVKVYPKGDVPVPISKVSSGEFILVAYLIMGAIHDITGVNILVIDDMDRLDKNNAKAFMSLLMKDTRFKNIILAGVNHEDFTTAIPNGVNNVTL